MLSGTGIVSSRTNIILINVLLCNQLPFIRTSVGGVLVKSNFADMSSLLFY